MSKFKKLIIELFIWILFVGLLIFVIKILNY